MHPRRLAVAALAIALAGSVGADDSRPRIVAVGDIHGDYDNFVQVLRDTGIVNERLRWSAGTTRLVQVGDIADRGPDTRRIIELLMTLEKQARRRKGAVHVLIGNHESMNMQGDLRYVHPGEYAAFVDRQSGGRRDRYFEATVRVREIASARGAVAGVRCCLPHRVRPAVSAGLRRNISSPGRRAARSAAGCWGMTPS